MFKQYTTYLFCAVLAIYFLLAGMGANVVLFCCSACAEEGIEHVAGSGCADLHQMCAENSEICCHQHKDACADPVHRGDACHFWRVTLSDVMQDECCAHLPHISCLSLPWLECVEAMNMDVMLLHSTACEPFMSDFSLDLEGRSVLSRHCVFLI